MVNTLASVVTNTWVQATWEEFVSITQDPRFGEDGPKTKSYFDGGWMRIEDMPIGSAHGQDNSILGAVISLYGTMKGLSYVGKD